MQAHGAQAGGSRAGAVTSTVAAAVMWLSLATAPGVALAEFGNQFEKLQLHMTPEQVEKLLGRPDKETKHGEYLIWRYADRLITSFGNHRSSYFVVFRAGKVADYGVGNVQAVDKGGVITIVPAN